MFTLLSNAFSKFSKWMHSRKATWRGRSTSSAVESLETRLVPAVTASVNNLGVLVVQGDRLNNSIRIESIDFGNALGLRVFADGQYVNIAHAGSHQPIVLTDAAGTSGIEGYLFVHAIEVYGHGGNDTVWTDDLGDFAGGVVMDGGGGNDLLSIAHAASARESVLIGGTGRDILVGGVWTDRLNGNAGRDILIGGLGPDFLYGGDAEDVLVPGYTNFDLNMVALRQIRTHWARTDLSYDQRIDSLLYGRHGYTGSALNESTVHTDWHRDEMFGDAGMDWFFTDNVRDDVRDTGGTGERLNGIWRP